MKVFLTSDLGAVKKEKGIYIPVAFSDCNGLLTQMKETLTSFENFVFIASNPYGYEKTDCYGNAVYESFALVGLKFKQLIILDNRTKKDAAEIIKNASFIFLGGGHVPTQNSFFNEIKLKELIKSYKGTAIMGQSAGAMNLAEIVYNYPEDESEINDPRWLKGLGLTNITIIPHFDEVTGNIGVCENFDLMKDYFLRDSKTQPIFAIMNFSHIVDDGKTQTAYGDVYVIKNGELVQISQSLKSKKINFAE